MTVTALNTLSTKVAIIGGGPVGLWAVFMCGMAKLRACVIEAMPFLGGQCQALYPDKPIYDIPGLPAVTAGDLVQHLKDQMAPFAPHLLLNTHARNLHRQEDGSWIIHTSDNTCVHTQSILICGGAGSLEPKRPPLPDLPWYEARQQVMYSVPAGHHFRGQHVVIAGGGDSAIDWAVLLGTQCAQQHPDAPAAVHVVHRRAHFRAQEHTMDQLTSLTQAGHVQVHAPYQLHGLHKSGDSLAPTQAPDACSESYSSLGLAGVGVMHLDGTCKILPADTLLAFFGLQGSVGGLTQWGLAMQQNRIIIDPTTGCTNLPGIYAAGDMAVYPHKMRLIVTGFAEVAQAVHHLKGYVCPARAGIFQHSTTQGLPTDFLE